MRKFIFPILVVLLFFGCEKNNILEVEIPQPNQMSLQDIGKGELPFSVEALRFKNNEDHLGDGFKRQFVDDTDDDFKLITGIREDKFVKHVWKNGFTSYSAPLRIALQKTPAPFGAYVRYFDKDNITVERYYLYTADANWFRANYQRLTMENYTGSKKVYDIYGKLLDVTYSVRGKRVSKTVYEERKTTTLSTTMRSTTTKARYADCPGCIVLDEVTVVGFADDDDDEQNNSEGSEGGGGGGDASFYQNDFGDNIGFWTKSGLDGNNSYDFHYMNTGGGGTSDVLQLPVTINPVGLKLNFEVKLVTEGLNVDLKKLFYNPQAPVSIAEVQYLAENEFILIQQLINWIQYENYSTESLLFFKAVAGALKNGGEVDFKNRLIYDPTLDQEYLGRMAKKEREIFDNLTDYQKTQYLMSAQQAWKYAELYYKESFYNGKGDAVRHAFWNALATVRLGEALTKRLTDAHETKPFEYKYHYKEKEMDLFNNAVGRELANKSGKLYKLIEQALANGDLRYLSNLLGGGQSGMATDKSKLTPTN